MDSRSHWSDYISFRKLSSISRSMPSLIHYQAVWSWVRAWTLRTLEKAGEKVADVQGDDEEEEDVPPQPATAAAGS